MSKDETHERMNSEIDCYFVTLHRCNVALTMGCGYVDLMIAASLWWIPTQHSALASRTNHEAH